ncbi:hypothetical protein GCM10011490_01190 [Pseudoclavibacter endophyticus]|nr:hypothetical protein GCM10011490_01190 [Pseudoclavibacter endophyticus]
MVMLGAVFGFLYWALVQAWNALAVAMGPAGDLAQHVVFGGWLLVAPIAVAIIRRPFVGVIAEVIASIIEVVFLGSPVGAPLLLAALLQGVGSELPFAVTRYRRFSWLLFAISGALGALLVFGYSAARYDWWGQDILLLRLGMQIVSGIVLGGLLAKVIVDALARTGVLDEFAIGRAGHTPRTTARRGGQASASSRRAEAAAEVAEAETAIGAEAESGDSAAPPRPVGPAASADDAADRTLRDGR